MGETLEGNLRILLATYYGPNVWLPFSHSPNLYVETLIPTVLVFGDRPLGGNQVMG